ncbi:hypothetical protein D3C75_1268780 [compost metagenome]
MNAGSFRSADFRCTLCLAELVRRLHKRRHDQAIERQVTLVVRLTGAEANGLGFRLRDVKRAEHPVPE